MHLLTVIAVADAADRWYEVGFGQTLGVVHGEILNAPVAMVDQAIFRPWPAGVYRLLQGVQHEAGGRLASALVV